MVFLLGSINIMVNKKRNTVCRNLESCFLFSSPTMHVSVVILGAVFGEMVMESIQDANASVEMVKTHTICNNM